jgi:tRNA (mo5U34)-methyltransferase
MSEIKDTVSKLAPWFHNIQLPDGTQTYPDHFLGDFPLFKWEQIKEAIPEDLHNWKVLDIGCNAGFYSLELAKRGASVTGVDIDRHYLRQASWVAEQFGLRDRIRFKQVQVYDLAGWDEEFDLVWFMGVFYHLRYPVLAMDIISRLCRNLLVFQTLTMPEKEIREIADDHHIHDRNAMLEKGWPKMAFIEKMFSKDPTNWWLPNHAAIISILSTCGFKVLSNPEEETYVFQVDEEKRPVADGWNRSEFLSAIQRPWKKEVMEKVAK